MKQTRTKSQFVVCVQNEDNDDLAKGKIYQVIEDEKAAQAEYLRVIDESGEDYLYPARYFVPIVLPKAAEAVLFASSSHSIPAA